MVRFDGITFTGNNPGGDGGGLFAELFGPAQLFLDHCVITDSFTGGAGGGGVIGLHDTALFEMFDCVVSNNLALNATGPTGGGLHIYLTDSSTGKISWSTIEGNSLQTGGTSSIVGAGIALLMNVDAQFEIVDSVFSNNVLGPTGGVRYGSEVYLSLYNGSPNVALRRNRFESDNSDSSNWVVSLGSNSEATTAISDSWFFGGNLGALFAQIADSGRLYFNNNTVTEISARSMFLGGYGTQFLISMTNNILWNNGTDEPFLEPGAVTSGNLIGVDPLFVNPGEKNYRLQAGSPAIDISTVWPAGGLSSIDLHGFTRVMGPAVDAGASEWGGLFKDGFEVGTTRMWTQ